LRYYRAAVSSGRLTQALGPVKFAPSSLVVFSLLIVASCVRPSAEKIDVMVVHLPQHFEAGHVCSDDLDCSPAGGDIDRSHFGPTVLTEEACIEVAGKWGRVSTESFKPQCDVPTTDGGKHCNDHAQCQGLCIATSNVPAGQIAVGQCRTSYLVTGRCDIRISNGRAEWRLCVD